MRQTLIVIGGSRGIGAAVVRLAAQRDYRVVVGYHINQPAAEAVVDEITAKGREAVDFPLDVTDPHSVELFLEQAVATYGVPDALALCAGIPGTRGMIVDISPDIIARTVETNLTGTFYCIQACAKRMMLSRGGSGGAITVISSEAARFGGNQISPYAASKAGINAMTIGVARELAKEGIRLNAISPGLIETDQFAGTSEEMRISMLKSIPLGRMGLPDEVARAVLWLLSDDASYVTGTILSVNGGR